MIEAVLPMAEQNIARWESKTEYMEKEDKLEGDNSNCQRRKMCGNKPHSKTKNSRNGLT